MRRKIHVSEILRIFFDYGKMSQPAYKYPDNYVASFKHLRDLNTSLRDDLLAKSGGVISAPIYETT